jgi:hypothetical protein
MSLSVTLARSVLGGTHEVYLQIHGAEDRGRLYLILSGNSPPSQAANYS